MQGGHFSMQQYKVIWICGADTLRPGLHCLHSIAVIPEKQSRARGRFGVGFSIAVLD
jgi:hypothetical protein